MRHELAGYDAELTDRAPRFIDRSPPWPCRQPIAAPWRQPAGDFQIALCEQLLIAVVADLFPEQGRGPLLRQLAVAPAGAAGGRQALAIRATHPQPCNHQYQQTEEKEDAGPSIRLGKL